MLEKITHEEYVWALKKSAIAAGKEVLIKVISKKLPFLFIPVLGAATSLVLGKIVEILLLETEFAIFFKYIDMRTDSQGRDFSKAALENYRVQLSGTPEEKEKYEKELVSKFRDFVILTR